jgi:hypothetical protein
LYIKHKPISSVFGWKFVENFDMFSAEMEFRKIDPWGHRDRSCPLEGVPRPRRLWDGCAQVQEVLLPLEYVGVMVSVARWCIFKPKIPNWLNLGGPCNGRCWFMYFMATFRIYFTTIWYILWPFGIFCRNLVHFPLFWYVFFK